MQAFESLSLGSSAELEWNDKIFYTDEVTAVIKLFKPKPTNVITVVLEGFDSINGKKIIELYRGEMPALVSDEESGKDIYTTSRTLEVPPGVQAVRLTYWLYKDRTPRSPPVARGGVWTGD